MAKNKLISEFIEEQIKQLRESERFGTANNYEKTLRSFMNFIGDRKMTFSDFDENLVSDYNSYLIKRGLMRNSVSFYMRILRAIYNKAVKQKLTVKKELFADVYTGIDKTRKRAVDEKIIYKLYELKLNNSTPLALARDIFIFSYCARGMSFVDIAYLKKSDISGGVIRYYRRKTGQMMSIKLESCMLNIINQYKNKKSIYVFPIIRSLDSDKSYRQYRSAINIYNRNLKELSKMIGLECGLSSYVSRHSWATIARKHDVPISVISAGMGHNSETTTQIYLKSIEDNEIDKFNAELIKIFR